METKALTGIYREGEGTTPDVPVTTTRPEGLPLRVKPTLYGTTSMYMILWYELSWKVNVIINDAIKNRWIPAARHRVFPPILQATASSCKYRYYFPPVSFLGESLL